jgi:hypothetical protein
LQRVFVADPAIKVNFGLQNRADDVNDAEVCAYQNLNKSCIFIFGEHEPGLTFDQEVNGRDVITFEVDVLVRREWGWSQQRANPSDEGRTPALEAVYLFVSVFMDEERNFKLQLVWQIENKVVDIVFVLVEIVFYSLP